MNCASASQSLCHCRPAVRRTRLPPCMPRSQTVQCYYRLELSTVHSLLKNVSNSTERGQGVPPKLRQTGNTCLTAFSSTTWLSWYQKDKPFRILLKQRWWNGNGISWTIIMQVICTLQPPAHNHASNSSVSFSQAGCHSCRPANSVKALDCNIVGKTMLVSPYSRHVE